MYLGKAWMFVWHKAAMIHGKLRCSVPKAKAELEGLEALGCKCWCSLCFGNSNASLDFSRDFQMVVWSEHLRSLSTLILSWLFFSLLYMELCVWEQHFFYCMATSVISDWLMSSQELERGSATRKTMLSWSFGQRVKWLGSTFQLLNKITWSGD